MKKGMIAIYLMLAAIALSTVSISILPWFTETIEVEGDGHVYESGWGVGFRETKDIMTEDKYLLTCRDCPNLVYYSLDEPPEGFFCNETVTNENATEGICNCCECTPEEMEKTLVWMRGDVTTNIAPLSNSVYKTVTYERGVSNRLVVSHRAENILTWGLYSLLVSFLVLLGFRIKLLKNYSHLAFILLSSVILISAPIYYAVTWPDAIDDDYVARGDDALGMGFQGIAISKVNSTQTYGDTQKINITYTWSPGAGWFFPIIAGMLGFFSFVLMGMQLREDRSGLKKKAETSNKAGGTDIREVKPDEPDEGEDDLDKGD